MNRIPFLSMLRPRQWIKNLIMFFPPFLSGSMLSSSFLLLTGTLSFISFCCVSSALYVFNDLNDMAKDELHPVKRLRPLPSGAVSKSLAIFILISLGLLGFVLALLAVQPLIPYLLLYAVVTIGYTTWFKNYSVVDLFCISCGFLIRLLAGGAIFTVEISEWLFLSVFFLSLFLSAGKRLSEQNLLGADAADHRTSLFRWYFGCNTADIGCHGPGHLHHVYCCPSPACVFRSALHIRSVQVHSPGKKRQ